MRTKLFYDAQQNIQDLAEKESQIAWAKKSPEMTIQERADYYTKIGNDYLKSKEKLLW